MKPRIMRVFSKALLRKGVWKGSDGAWSGLCPESGPPAPGSWWTCNDQPTCQNTHLQGLWRLCHRPPRIGAYQLRWRRIQCPCSICLLRRARKVCVGTLQVPCSSTSRSKANPRIAVRFYVLGAIEYLTRNLWVCSGRSHQVRCSVKERKGSN